MERRNEETLAAFSDALADAAESVGRSVVRVIGGRRHSGSGVVYAPGMVLTVSHVLEREGDVSVTASGGEPAAARLVGRDPAADLAVLAVEGLEAEAASPAGGEPRVGQLALAVGRSGRDGGLRVTSGVVSAAGGPARMWRGGRLERYLQTDAAVYPGLSGGALVDARGAVIGVLTAGWGRGATFVIPTGIAWSTAEALAERGTIRRGYLGILSQPVRLPESQRGGISRRGGLLVVGVEEGSPASRGGLLVGDILVAFDGEPVEDTDDLLALLAGERVGREVPVEVVRGGERRELGVPVEERG